MIFLFNIGGTYYYVLVKSVTSLSKVIIFSINEISTTYHFFFYRRYCKSTYIIVVISACNVINNVAASVILYTVISVNT